MVADSICDGFPFQKIVLIFVRGINVLMFTELANLDPPCYRQLR